MAAVLPALLLLAAGCAGQKNQPSGTGQILLASTIGPIDAGIVSALEDSFEKKTGIRVRHVGAGTGAALKMAESGNFDLVMAHAKALEEKFVADGFGTRRIDLMYNDFVIMGPESDPAGIKGLKAYEALKRIMESKSLFISRGDNSGTHVAEKELWQAAGLKPAGDWYRVYEKGAEGNAKTLKYADEQKAYTFIDRATYLTMKNDISLKVLVEKDESLLNFISLIPVNPQKFPGVKYKQAMQFVEFCTSKEGQTIIRDFGKDKYGEPLFFPNSTEGKALSKT
ncbi:MAG: solute-binding protein [Pelotomaculum sp.]|nr:solute-binding protein [Pelotomaculum sp.]